MWEAMAPTTPPLLGSTTVVWQPQYHGTVLDDAVEYTSGNVRREAETQT